MRTTLTILALALLLATGCKSPRSLYAKGKYAEAVELGLKRIRQGKADDRDVRALADAFDRMNGGDIVRLEGLLGDKDPARYDEAILLAERIRGRQELVHPYLPLKLPESGAEVTLRTKDVRELLPRLREEAAAWHYREAGAALERARQGDKRAAREAHERLTKVRTYHAQPYPDLRALLDEAAYLALTQVRLVVENQTPAILPGSFRLQLEETFNREVAQPFLRLVVDEGPCRDCDLEARIIVATVAVSPDGVQEDRRVARREVEDGFQYVLDQRGHVMKDSSGNDIKVPKLKEVVAEVFQTRQTKAARIEGFLEVRRARGGAVLRRLPVAGETRFLHESVWLRGDERALDAKGRKQLRGQPVPFPPSDKMLADAADIFRAEIGRALANERAVFQE